MREISLALSVMHPSHIPSNSRRRELPCWHAVSVLTILVDLIVRRSCRLRNLFILHLLEISSKMK